MEMETTSAHTFVNDAVAKNAVREGLASVARVEPNYVDVDMSSITARRLANTRRLAANIAVTYSIDIGGNAPASIAVTGDEVRETLESSNQQAINAAVKDEIAEARQGQYNVYVENVEAPLVEVIILNVTNLTQATELEPEQPTEPEPGLEPSATTSIHPTTTGGNPTSTLAPSLEVRISTEMVMANVLGFNLTSYANAMSVAMNTSASRVRITRVEYAVMVSFTFDANVTEVQARDAFAQANAVHRDNVTVSWSDARRLFLQPRRLSVAVAATIKAASPEAAAAVQATASNGSALAQSLVATHDVILGVPTLGAAPVVAVSVETAIAVQDVAGASMVEVQVQSGSVTQAMGMTFGVDVAVDDLVMPDAPPMSSTVSFTPPLSTIVPTTQAVLTSVASTTSAMVVAPTPEAEESGALLPSTSCLVVMAAAGLVAMIA